MSISYLSSPGSQMHADWVSGMDVLLSYALYPKGDSPWIDSYVQSFRSVLIDSGAFSEFNSGKKVDGDMYKDWQCRWDDVSHVVAIAGLDDISGDWRRSLRNYENYGGFPTFHESDPHDLLDDLIPMARERGNWIGVGLIPPRTGKTVWVRDTVDRIPDDLHVHIWAGGEYAWMSGCDSWDSTNWFRDAWDYKNNMPFLTPAECIEIVVKRYQRVNKVPSKKQKESIALNLFS